MENNLDPFNAKCAEVFYENFKDFAIVCTQCSLKTSKFEEFEIHFKEVHNAVKKEEIWLDDDNFPVETKIEDSIQDNEGESEDEGSIFNDGECESSNSEDDKLPLCHIRNLQRKKSCKTKKPKETLSEYGCIECKKNYKNKIALQRHLRYKHHGTIVKAFQCSCCEKSYDTKVSLQSHCLMRHNGIGDDVKTEKYTCATCNKVYIDKYTFKYHLIRHTGIRNFVCDAPGCGMEFFNIRGLNSHKRFVHIGKKNFICETCGHRTKTSASLKMHERTHTGEKPYKCSICEKAFATKGGVAEHKVIHSNKKPHVCDICGKSFIRPKGLYHHKYLHLDEKQFVCKICGKAFAQISGLSAHKRQHR